MNHLLKNITFESTVTNIMWKGRTQGMNKG